MRYFNFMIIFYCIRHYTKTMILCCYFTMLVKYIFYRMI